MAFRLVDPMPFMPLGAERRVVEGRPIMRRVVIGHVAQRNNDVVIAVLQPMPYGPINFMAIHNSLDDFLHQRAIGFRLCSPALMARHMSGSTTSFREICLFRIAPISMVMALFPLSLIIELGIIALLL